MTYRIIPTETHSAALNMALDEACMEAVRAGDSPPTIRIYRWSPGAVSIGYFQCLTDEVDLEAAREDGISLVRRQTGGGAVYHDPEGEITYSIIAPETDFTGSVRDSYERICSTLITALASVGIAAEFRPINDIIVDGKKISGNAQTRKSGILLQHGTLLHDLDVERMFRYLTPDKAKISDKPFIKSVKSAVTSILEQRRVDRAVIEAALRKSLTQEFSARPGGWNPEELTRARQLAADKYADESWIAMR